MTDLTTEIFLVSSTGFAVLDSGCGKTIIGDRTLKQFQKLWQDDGRYSPKFKSETNVFMFETGERETTTSPVIMSVGLAGRFGTIQAAVVQGDAPLLLSRPALTRLGATIDFHADRLPVFHEAIDLTDPQVYLPQDVPNVTMWGRSIIQFGKFMAKRGEPSLSYAELFEDRTNVEKCGYVKWAIAQTDSAKGLLLDLASYLCVRLDGEAEGEQLPFIPGTSTLRVFRYWIRWHAQELIKTYKEMAISLPFSFYFWDC